MNETTTQELPARQWTEHQHLVHLLEHHAISCPRCRHDLHGIREPVCPSCGSELALSLSASSFSYVPWILLLTVSGLCAGLGLFYVLIIIEEGWPPWGDFGEVVFWVTMWALFLLIPAPVLVYRGRQRLWRYHPADQWRRGGMLAAGLLAVFVTNLVCLFLLL